VGNYLKTISTFSYLPPSSPTLRTVISLSRSYDAAAEEHSICPRALFTRRSIVLSVPVFSRAAGQTQSTPDVDAGFID
jgi:hypothetical protein